MCVSFNWFPKPCRSENWWQKTRKLILEANTDIQRHLRQTLYLTVLQFVSSSCCCDDVDGFLQLRTLFLLFEASLVSSSTRSTLWASFFVCCWARAEVYDSHSIFLTGINSNPANLQPMNPEKPQSVEVVTRHWRQKQGERKGHGKTDWKKRKKYMV